MGFAEDAQWLCPSCGQRSPLAEAMKRPDVQRAFAAAERFTAEFQRNLHEKWKAAKGNRPAFGPFTIETTFRLDDGRVVVGRAAIPEVANGDVVMDRPNETALMEAALAVREAHSNVATAEANLNEADDRLVEMQKELRSARDSATSAEATLRRIAEGD